MDAYLEIKEETEFAAIADRLHFVETVGYFEGLDLCAGSESGFNGYDLANIAYSLHPNAIGHDAFFDAMKAQLTE